MVLALLAWCLLCLRGACFACMVLAPFAWCCFACLLQCLTSSLVCLLPHPPLSACCPALPCLAAAPPSLACLLPRPPLPGCCPALPYPPPTLTHSLPLLPARVFLSSSLAFFPSLPATLLVRSHSLRLPPSSFAPTLSLSASLLVPSHSLPLCLSPRSLPVSPSPSLLVPSHSLPLCLSPRSLPLSPSLPLSKPPPISSYQNYSSTPGCLPTYRTGPSHLAASVPVPLILLPLYLPLILLPPSKHHIFAPKSAHNVHSYADAMLASL
eukprot:352283-Chlamydomonas_euryale.AAC.1